MKTKPPDFGTARALGILPRKENTPYKRKPLTQNLVEEILAKWTRTPYLSTLDWCENVRASYKKGGGRSATCDLELIVLSALRALEHRQHADKNDQGQWRIW